MSRGVSHWRSAVVLLLFALSMIACTWVDDMGTVAIATPMTFTGRGETDHRWDLPVIPGRRYEVTVSRNDGIHDTIAITACLYRPEMGCGDESTLAHIHSIDRAENSVTFTAPDQPTVYLVVIALTGENHADMGLYTLTVHELHDD